MQPHIDPLKKGEGRLRLSARMDSLKGVLLNGVLIAVIAHGLIGVSLVWDKVLLEERQTQSILSYIFWLGAISIFGIALLPFGFRMPRLPTAAIGFLAGLLDLLATYFYYSALQSGEASEELAVMGGFSPVATALIALPLLDHPIGGSLIGFGIMTAGGFLMFFAEKQPLRKMLPNILMAAAVFGFTAVLQKIVFDHTNFVSGFVFITIGTAVGAFALLIPPSWRRQILDRSKEASPKKKTWYMANRLLAGIGSFLVVFALSRTSPALVSAISGVRYVIIFLGAYAITNLKPSWFREDFRKWILITKLAATCLVVAGLVLVGMQGGGTGAGPR